MLKRQTMNTPIATPSMETLRDAMVTKQSISQYGYNERYLFYMHMFVCMHVCMYACMHACMHASIYIYTYIYIYYMQEIAVQSTNPDARHRPVRQGPGSLSLRHASVIFSSSRPGTRRKAGSSPQRLGPTAVVYCTILNAKYCKYCICYAILDYTIPAYYTVLVEAPAPQVKSFRRGVAKRVACRSAR